ncbi:MAG: 4Fe-4S binding protein, partial [Clostridia bacterium]
PKRLIELVPVTQRTFVKCRSREKGAVIKDICKAGCIGCKICEKNCPTGAVTVTDNIASIQYDICTNCGLCAEKCPKKVIEFKQAM